MASDGKCIVISQPWGGLGDNLQFTTLPELYSKLGYKVYISSKNAYRNPEIYDLVWKLNPFISGVSDLPPNAGECRGYRIRTMNYMKNLELAHGLTDGCSEYPIIYYKPNLIPDLSNALIYDVTSISTNPSDESIRASFNSVFVKYPELNIKKITFANIKNRYSGYFNHEKHVINSIFDLCDAIYSCKVFLVLHSGAAVLASAIKQDNATPELYVFHPASTHAPFYIFKNGIYKPYLDLLTT